MNRKNKAKLKTNYTDTDCKSAPVGGDIEDNRYDYYLFYGTEEIGEVELCLSRNRMNVYYGHLRYLLLTKIPNEEFSPLYKLINVENMVGTWKLIGETTEREYFHEGSFNYGIKIHYISDTIYPIQID